MKNILTMISLAILSTLLLVSLGCGFGLKKPNKTNSKPTVTTDEVDTEPRLPDELAEVTMKDCNARGVVWIATDAEGSEASCGEPLAPWPCCKEQVLARFPSFEEELVKRFDSMEFEGKTLYNCGRIASNSHKIHFFSEDETNGLRTYFGTTIPGVEVANDITCP